MIILNSSLIKRFLLLLLLLALCAPAPVRAQSDPPDKQIYVVESGDTLNSIAIRFNVAVNDLIAAK